MNNEHLSSAREWGLVQDFFGGIWHEVGAERARAEE